mgnify:FL=1
MSETNPPIEDVPVFNPIYWASPRPDINVAYLDANYLKFPNSQASPQTFTSGLFSDGQIKFTSTVAANKAVDSLVDLTFDTAESGKITFSDGTIQTTAPTFQLPVGSIVPFVGTQALPSGFLLADGSSVAEVAFPALFTVIGTTFGSAAPGFFNLPTKTDRWVIATL